MLYLDFNNEVKTDHLITKLISLKKTVAAPVTIKDKRKLIPFKITNLKDGINIGSYGIREPKQNPYNELNVEDIDILIVPAVAYDKNCYRLGYGGGFYDRFIECLREDAITIGIAFDLQVFDYIPKENHDAQLNYLITENNISRKDLIYIIGLKIIFQTDLKFCDMIYFFIIYHYLYFLYYFYFPYYLHHP